MTDFRKDAHQSMYRTRNMTAEERKNWFIHQDCSHWCLPGVADNWNKLLSTQGDASSAALTSLGLQTPVKGHGTGLCHLNTEQATIPMVSTAAQHTKSPVAKRTWRTRSTSEQSNITGFYREASDDDSDFSVAGRVAIFEFAGRRREFAGGHGSPPKTSQVPFGGRITRSQRAGAAGEDGDEIVFGLSGGGASLEIEIFRDRVGEERC
nr:protein trichome birefringence-like 1 [Ipomoea batatas]GMD82478.1 protein trichome birefringence-like 1 [Ipomoea batatas]